MKVLTTLTQKLYRKSTKHYILSTQLYVLSTQLYIRASTKELWLRSRSPYFVHIRLSTTSPKCVASSGSTDSLRSLRLSFSNLPSRCLTLVLFIEMRMYLHLVALNRLSGKRVSVSARIADHSRNLSCCGGSMPRCVCCSMRHPFFSSRAMAISL